MKYLLFILFTVNCYAGGGPLNLLTPEFDPKHIGNNVASYDAFYGATIVAGNVTVLVDQTGSGKTMTVSTNKPAQVVGQNGRFLVRFTNFAHATTTPFFVGNNFHWFITSKFFGTGAQQIICNTATNRQISTGAGQIPTCYDGTSTVTGTAWDTTSLVFTAEWSASAGTVQFFTNGISTGGVAGGTLLNPPLAYNSIGNVLNVAFLTNDLYRIDGFNTKLTGTKQLLMENYHRTEWRVW